MAKREINLRGFRVEFILVKYLLILIVLYVLFLIVTKGSITLSDFGF